MRKQIKIYAGKDTEKKWTEICRRFTSNTAAFAALIENYHSNTQTEEEMYIDIEFSEDSLFSGNDDQDLETYNINASMKKYGELLKKCIETEFPKAEITITQGINNHMKINGRSDHKDMDIIADCISGIYQEWEWIIEK